MANNKRIVVTGTRGIPNIMGGVETHCEELFPRIAQKGYDVTIIRRGAYVDASSDLAAGVTADGDWKGLHLIDIPSPKKKSFEAIIHTFRAIIRAKREKADILHIHAIGPALLVPFAKMLGMKVVFTHHGPDYDRDKWGFVAKTILKIGEWLGCKFADEVIVISDVIRRLISKRCSRTKNVHLIYNGAPKPNLCSLPDYFQSLGIENNKYIFAMCRFVPEKNLHHLVEAYEKLKAVGKLEGYKLVLAGDSDFVDEYSLRLKQRARKAGAVLTGFIKGEKLESLITNCGCFVLPSSHEGLPIALLEAMSYGAPVVVSNIPANLEVGLNKESYFQCGDVDALATGIEATLNKGTDRVKYDMSRYDWDYIANQLADVYKQI